VLGGHVLASSSADAYSIIAGVDFGKNLAIAFIMFALGAAGILIWQVQSPIFHTILDTSAFLASGLVALLLWDISKRTDQPLAWFLAIAFGVVAAAELVHTWQGLGYHVDVPADLSVELQNAHLIASGRARSEMDRLLLHNLEGRYQEIMVTISPDAGPERMTARGQRPPAG